MDIHISKHALERYIERWNHKTHLRELSHTAFTHGTILSESEQRRMFQKGLVATDPYWGREYRVYSQNIFVFDRQKNGSLVLITILPR